MSSPKRILIVDDDENLRSILEALLEPKGYEIIQASDGEEGLQQVKTRHPDIIILDGMMPKKSGFQLAYELKNHPVYESIPVIMLTGIERASGKTQEYWQEKSRADLYISKPFNYTKLVETVAKMLEEHYRESDDGLTRYRV
jgi:DNA-binding response OmpR family regulator